MRPLREPFTRECGTGSEMIVCGGYNGSIYLNTGGRYNPSTDSWTATSATNAPVARWHHTAVWTPDVHTIPSGGSGMIVWGGNNTSGDLNTGGKYNVITDSWTATSTTNAPVAREDHTAVWAGGEMIVWGGDNTSGDLNTGGRYCVQGGPSPTPTPRPVPTARPRPTPPPRP